jgi:DNA primase
MTQNLQYSLLKFSSSSSIEKAVLDLFKEKNIAIYNQSATEIAALCPFHNNKHSPSLYINTKTGLWQCFNPSCGAKGNFRQIYKSLTGKNYGREWALDPVNLQKELDVSLRPPQEEELSIESTMIDYQSEDVLLLETMTERGFTLDTLRYFEVGYSKIKDRVTLPVRNAQYKLIGIIGRAIHDYQQPKYLYNKGLKRGELLFNIQNAKGYEEVIVCEGSLDAVKIHQSGFENVVATLGAQVTAQQNSILRKYFDSIVIFSDRDAAGESMKEAIINGCRGKELSWMRVPDHLKDPGDMAEEQIVKAFTNKQTITGEK